MVDPLEKALLPLQDYSNTETADVHIEEYWVQYNGSAKEFARYIEKHLREKGYGICKVQADGIRVQDY